jgi:hypothetical protein
MSFGFGVGDAVARIQIIKGIHSLIEMITVTKAANKLFRLNTPLKCLETYFEELVELSTGRDFVQHGQGDGKAYICSQVYGASSCGILPEIGKVPIGITAPSWWC